MVQILERCLFFRKVRNCVERIEKKADIGFFRVAKVP